MHACMHACRRRHQQSPLHPGGCYSPASCASYSNNSDCCRMCSMEKETTKTATAKELLWRTWSKPRTNQVHIIVFHHIRLFSKSVVSQIWYSHRSSDDSDVHCQYAVNPSYKETTREQISRSNSFTDSSYTESIPRKDALLCTQNQEDCQREMENIAANGYQLEPATPTSCTVTPTNPAPIYWNFKELQAVNKKPADTTVQYENPLKLLRKKSIDKPLLHNIKSGNQEIQEEVLLTPYEVPYKSTLVWETAHIWSICMWVNTLVSILRIMMYVCIQQHLYNLDGL